jgi:hypothetical protein
MFIKVKNTYVDLGRAVAISPDKQGKGMWVYFGDAGQTSVLLDITPDGFYRLAGKQLLDGETNVS